MQEAATTIRPGQAAHGKTQTCGLLISSNQSSSRQMRGRPCSPARIHALEDCSHGPLQSPLGSGQARPDRTCLEPGELNGGKVNRGIIGVIVGVLVIIILVIVILQLT